MGNKSTYNEIIESKLLLEIDSVFKKYSDRKLRFYELGLVVFPVKYIGKIALKDALIETWVNINKYRFDKPKGLYKNASKSLFEKPSAAGQDYCLHIETNGVFPRCVNQWGMSAFGLMGFLLNEKQVEDIRGIFKVNGVEESAETET